MRLFLCFAGLLLLCHCNSLKVASQDDELGSNELYVDEFDHLYTIEQNNTLIKYNKEGEQLFEYSDNTLGAINVLDVSNPLQLLVFHKSFQIVKILGRTLTLSGQIDLNKLNLFEIKTVGSANDNSIWIFDELNQELLKVDKNGKVERRNNDLRLRIETNVTPHKIVEYQNKVYLFDKAQGILIFNAFGEYMNQRRFDHQGTFSYLNGKLLFSDPKGLINYDLKEGTSKVLELAPALHQGHFYHLIDKELIYLKENKIQFHSLN